MTAILSSSISLPNNYRDPSNYETFFSAEEREEIENEYLKVRELSAIGKPGESCKNNLFFGFFLDGTRNSYAKSLDKQNHTESNIARLYSAYPGQSVPGVLPATTEWKHQPASYNNYFRVYTPGVGTAFAKVKDTGEGRDAMMGAAFAALGERRIIWTLAQAINNLHRYYRKSALLSEGDILALCREVSLTAQSLADMTGPSAGDIYGDAAKTSSARQAFEAVLKKLHSAIRLYMVDPRLGRPFNIDPGQVKEIFVSVFGFSRGATAARAFAN